MANSSPQEVHTLPAKTGIALHLSKGQSIEVINVHGKQVVDTWALGSSDLSYCLSMEHIHVKLLKLSIAVGDTLVNNHRSPMLTVVADTTPGVHDTTIAACDKYRYAELGAVGYHRSCTDNFHEALKRIGKATEHVPAPLNLFMNVPVAADGGLSFATPVSEAGQSITLRAEMDLILVMSACPQDMTDVNGMGCADVHYRIC